MEKHLYTSTRGAVKVSGERNKTIEKEKMMKMKKKKKNAGSKDRLI